MKTWVHRFASKFFPRRAITIIPWVWFAGAFQVSCPICKTLFGIYHAFWRINQFLAGLHFLSKGIRIAVQSRSLQRCRRMIRGVWVLANQNARLRTRAQQGGTGHGLVGTWLSWVKRVLFEIIYFVRCYFKTFAWTMRGCRKGWASSFDQGESNGADVLSMAFGFWPIRTHDSDHARGRGGHRPRFSGQMAIVSEPCAIWKHLHYLTSYFWFNDNMSSSFCLQIFSTVRNHDCTLWFDFMVHFTRRQASLAISNFEYAEKRYSLYVYIVATTCVC